MIVSDFEISWREAALAARLLSRNPAGFQLRSQRVAAIEGTSDIISLSNASFKSSLLHLVANFARCEATDPRDKVYALLGLSKDAQTYETALLQVDYTIPASNV